MFRWIVAALLIANVVFYSWSQGWLDDVTGLRARGDREPERMLKQVRPESVRVVTAQAVAAAASAAEARLACLEAGPFSNDTIAAAESALSTTLPAGSWVRRSTEVPARWILYMGRYPNREAMQKKEQELARIRVSFEELSAPPEFAPGLALGRFADRESAEAALQQLTQRGVQTARVLELSKGSSAHVLRVERADADLAAKVSGLRLDALGRGFTACPRVS